MTQLRPYLPLVVSLLLTFTTVPLAEAADVIIDQDTIIDAGNSFPTAGIKIVDGLDGPTQVQLVNGGFVGLGSSILENSHLMMSGGTLNYFTHVGDHARLTMTGGGVECDIQCAAIDYAALLSATDFGEIHLYGGSISGGLFLQGSATAHIYGTGLAADGNLMGESVTVTGVLASGLPLSMFVFQGPGTQVVLHNVPEPSTLLVSLVLVSGLGAHRRKSAT